MDHTETSNPNWPAFAVSAAFEDIRLALGASHGDILSLVLRQSLGVTLIGVVLGLAGALALSRVMQNYVYGITPPIRSSSRWRRYANRSRPARELSARAPRRTCRSRRRPTV